MLFIRMVKNNVCLLKKINEYLCYIIEKMVVSLQTISDTKITIMRERLSNIIEATTAMPMGIDKIIFFID